MTEQHPGSASDPEQDELAPKFQAMCEVGSGTDEENVDVDVETMTVRLPRPVSPRPGGEPYFPERPPTDQ